MPLLIVTVRLAHEGEGHLAQAIERLESGMTVRLKSGGPLMTIDEIEDDTKGRPVVRCIWFEGTKQVRGNFPAATVTPDDGVPTIA